MEALSHDVWRLLRAGGTRGTAAHRTRRRAVQAVDPLGEGPWLVCARCGNRITTAAARIPVLGREEHECTNPHGIRYRIGCFAAATGLVATGPPESAYTWFPGYRWQVQACGGCSDLAGWLYTSADHSFHGLVLDALKEEQES